MATFLYEGTGGRGERRSGEVVATTRGEALRRLTQDQIQPLSLREKGNISGTTRLPEKRHDGALRLSNAQIILFTDELADFLHAGLQLEPALQLMENREEASALKQVAKYLREKVRDGTSFSEALRTGSPSFGDLYCNLVAAGEVSGALAPLLRRQAEYLAALQDLRSRIQVALIYPAILILFGLVAMVIFMTVLIPQMVSLFAKTGTTMPTPTYILFQMGYFSQHYGLFTALFLAALVTLFNVFIRQPAGRRWWDEFKLKIPLLGPLLSASFYAQFCQTLANLLQNGLPLLSALKLMSRATGNVFYSALILRLTDLVGEGATLTRAMKSVGHFPANLRDLVKVGEQTGDLGTAIGKVAERYDKIIQVRIDRIMTLIQPVLLVVMGGMVGLVAWSMMSGIFQAIKGLRSHT